MFRMRMQKEWRIAAEEWRIAPEERWISVEKLPFLLKFEVFHHRPHSWPARSFRSDDSSCVDLTLIERFHGMVTAAQATELPATWDRLIAQAEDLVVPKASFFKGRIFIFLVKNLHLYMKLTAKRVNEPVDSEQSLSWNSY